MQCFEDLAKAPAWMTGLSINVDQHSAIFLSAVQNKPQNYSKRNQTESRAQRLICRIWDSVGISANAKVSSMEIVPFELDRLKH